MIWSWPDSSTGQKVTVVIRTEALMTVSIQSRVHGSNCFPERCRSVRAFVTDRHHHPEAPSAAIKVEMLRIRNGFDLLALRPRWDLPWAGRLTCWCWGERLQHRVKLSTQYCGITIQTLITHVYVRPCQARTPGQCSPVSVSAVRKVRLPLDVYILQTEGRMEGERERDGWGGGMTYSCSAPTQSPPRLSASGHGHNILWLNIAV